MRFNFHMHGKCHVMHIGQNHATKYYLNKKGVKTEVGLSSLQRDGCTQCTGLHIGETMQQRKQCQYLV